MATPPSVSRSLEVVPLDAATWERAAPLFGTNGLYGGCWCMWWRLSSAGYDQARSPGRRQRFLDLLDGASPPGLVAFLDGRPVGWVSVGPRPDFPRTPHLKPVDETPVWIIVCFFVARDVRGQGVGAALLDAAVKYTHEHGAEAVEGVPLDPQVRPVDEAGAWTGVVPMFRAAGFDEIARRSPTARVVMRRRRGAGRATPTPGT